MATLKRSKSRMAAPDGWLKRLLLCFETEALGMKSLAACSSAEASRRLFLQLLGLSHLGSRYPAIRAPWKRR